tara:strand:- start:39 stop:464 length:426 start_codon:yes stop_codon:yes gene_type:complete
MNREEAKTVFFAWLYNPESRIVSSDYYNRSDVLQKWYSDGSVKTPLGRELKVEQNKALNYLIQSTTSDLVLMRALTIDRFLEDKKSFISHIVHDEIVIDFDDEDRRHIADIKKMFAQNELGDYIVNMKAGKNFLEMEDLII